MRAYSRYSPVLALLGIAAAIAAAVIRLIQGEVTVNVQASIAAALILLALYLALEAEAIQKWAGGRQARYGANTVAASLAFVAIIGIVNYLSNSRYHKDWDLTENQINSLSQQTIDVLTGLPEPVKATAFISGQFESYRDSTKRLLEQYRDRSNGKFSFEIVDPLVKRTLAAQMGVTKDATVIFTLGDRKEETNFGDEKDFTSALIRLAHPEKRIVYFITGHGERALDDTADNGYSKIKSGLERQNYTIQTLNLVVTDTIPADAAAIVVAGPQVSLTVTETLALGKYFEGGGGGIFLLDPTLQMKEGQGANDALVDWLAKTWGIRVANDVVIDPGSSQAGEPFAPFAFDYGNSPITEKLGKQRLTSEYPLARSISGSDTTGAAGGPQNTPLVITSPQAWGETDLNSLSTGAKPDPGADQIGQLNLAITSENPATRARIVVFGDADFASNFFAESYANGDMLYNSVNWVTGNTDLISIPAKDSTFRAPLDLSTRTIATLGLLTVCALPFGVLLIGAFVLWRRRTQYQ